MFKILTTIFFLLFAFSVQAANTPPPGSNGQIPYNKNGQWGVIPTGTSSAATQQGALNALFFPTPAVGSGSPVVGPASPVVIPCGPGGAESAFNSVITSSQSMILPFSNGSPCEADNQLNFSTGQYFSLVGGGGGTEDNTGSNVVPYLLVNAGAISSNSTNNNFINGNAFRQIVVKGVRIRGSAQTPSVSFAGTNVSPNQGIGQCCDWNTISYIDASFGNLGTDMGCATDESGICIQANGINTTTLTSGGTGYGPGNYMQVPLTGGSGSGATAYVSVGTTGAVTGAFTTTFGTGYAVNDVLSASNTNLGNSGSGLQITVNSLYPHASLTSGAFLPHIRNTDLSDSLSGVAGNLSDPDIQGNQFIETTCAICYNFGAGEGRIEGNRFEGGDQGINLGVINPGFMGSTIINGNIFTDAFEFWVPEIQINIGKGTGYIISNNHEDDDGSSVNTVVQLGSVANSVSRVSVMGNIFEMGAQKPSGYKILNNGTNNLIFLGNQVYGSSLQEAVDFSNISSISLATKTVVWDAGIDAGTSSVAFHGRVTANYPTAINCLHNTNTLDVCGQVAIGSSAGFAGVGNSVTGGTVAPTNGLIVEGNVGIGTNTATVPLNVVAIGTAAVAATLTNTSGSCTLTPGSGSLTTACASDANLKQDIAPSLDALGWLSDIKVRDYTLKATGERVQGVVAQEMLKHHDDMVHMQPNGLYAVDQPNPWILVKAIQEQQWEIRIIYMLIFVLFAKVFGIFYLLHRKTKPKLDQDTKNMV